MRTAFASEPAVQVDSVGEMILPCTNHRSESPDGERGEGRVSSAPNFGTDLSSQLSRHRPHHASLVRVRSLFFPRLGHRSLRVTDGGSRRHILPRRGGTVRPFGRRFAGHPNLLHWRYAAIPRAGTHHRDLPKTIPQPLSCGQIGKVHII